MSSQWKVGEKKRRNVRLEREAMRPVRLGPPTGTEHYQRTAGMVGCTGVVVLETGEGPMRHPVEHVLVSKVWWDSKKRGTYVSPTRAEVDARIKAQG